MKPIPGWVIFHVPHDATDIPEAVRYQFAIDDAELRAEILKMTDHLTMALFTQGVSEGQIVRAGVSRLVVDVERFMEDEFVPMSACGMGVVYERTSDGKALRHPITAGERQALIETWYRPHHKRLTSITQQVLHQYGRALVIDSHSFPSRPLPYEENQREDRPEICIGTDGFHTPGSISDAFMASFLDAGFEVLLNTPFAGALVPRRHYRSDPRASAVMIEVNRALYLDETTGKPNESFGLIAEAIRQCIVLSIETTTIKGPLKG